MLNGKSILITGGTGSFGKMFTKMILEHYHHIKLLGKITLIKEESLLQNNCMYRLR